MKKRNQIIVALLLVLAVVTNGCHFHNRHVKTVRVSNDHSSLKIQYCGKIVFNQDRTAIENISPDGFVKYKKNDEVFAVQRDGNGGLSYKLYDGTRYMDYNDAYAKEFVTRVVKEIAEHY